MAEKEEVVLDGVRRSGASARFDGIGVEDEAGEEDAEYFPLSVENGWRRRRNLRGQGCIHLRPEE